MAILAQTAQSRRIRAPAGLRVAAVLARRAAVRSRGECPTRPRRRAHHVVIASLSGACNAENGVGPAQPRRATPYDGASLHARPYAAHIARIAVVQARLAGTALEVELGIPPPCRVKERALALAARSDPTALFGTTSPLYVGAVSGA